MEEAAAGREEGDMLPASRLWVLNALILPVSPSVPSLGSGNAGAPKLPWGEGKHPASGSSDLCVSHTGLPSCHLPLPGLCSWASKWQGDVDVEQEARNAVGMAGASREG